MKKITLLIIVLSITNASNAATKKTRAKVPTKTPLKKELSKEATSWSVLTAAIQAGNLAKVQDVIPSTLSINSVSPAGKTPLELAQTQAKIFADKEQFDAFSKVSEIIDYFTMLLESEASSSPKDVVKSPKSKKKLSFGQVLTVPKDLAGKVIYIQSVQQPKDACGYHAIINLWSLQDLLAHSHMITSDTINTKFLEKETSEPLVCKKEVEISQMIQFIDRNFPNLHDIFFIRFNMSSNTVQAVGCHNLSSKIDFNQYIEELRYRTRSQGYFIANTGAHWVLIALITIEDQTIIVYLNSMNSPLTTQAHAYKILKELVRLLYL